MSSRAFRSPARPSGAVAGRQRRVLSALVAAIDGASREVRLETYIFDVTGAGADVAQALERAASAA